MRLLSLLLATLATGLFCLPGRAAPPVRVSTSPDLGGTVLTGNILLFPATTGAEGTELWRSDGTLAGTQLLKDIVTGATGSLPGNFTLMGGLAYFTAFNGSSYGLWRSDGTAVGTTKVADLPGFPTRMQAAGDTLFFHVSIAGDLSLWRSDGTGAGTIKLADGFLYLGDEFTPFAGKVFFTIETSAYGEEVWVTDGTPGGTVVLKDINPGPSDGIPTGLRVVNGSLLFGAFDDANGYRLWRTDGTSVGTQPVAPFEISGDFGPVLGDAVVLTGHDASGFGLWRSDGTLAGSYAVRSFAPDVAARPQNYIAHQGVAYFGAATASGTPSAFFRSDGTSSGTASLQMALPLGATFLRAVGAVGEEVFFLVQESASVRAIWGADRNLRVTRKRFDLTSTADIYVDTSFRSAQGGLYFTVYRSGSDTTELWFIGAENPAGDDDNDGIPNAIEPSQFTNTLVKDNDIFTVGRLFAMQQYRDFLGREGDVDGILFYATRLNSGQLQRTQVIEAFLASSEFQAGLPQCTRLYFSFFGRIPDYGGLLFQVNAFRAGVPLATIAQNFYNSPEFTSRYGALSNEDYINLVYQNVLGRAPDPGGFQFYKDLLDNNTITKGEMMVGFSESPEFQAIVGDEVYVTAVYVGMLRRAPDQGGMDFYVNQIESGTPRNAIVTGFLASPEYRSRFLP